MTATECYRSCCETAPTCRARTARWFVIFAFFSVPISCQWLVALQMGVSPEYLQSIFKWEYLQRTIPSQLRAIWATFSFFLFLISFFYLQARAECRQPWYDWSLVHVSFSQSPPQLLRIKKWTRDKCLRCHLGARQSIKIILLINVPLSQTSCPIPDKTQKQRTCPLSWDVRINKKSLEFWLAYV